MLRAASLGSVPRLLAASAVAVPVTGTAAETTVATVSVPAGSMGTSGAIQVVAYFSMTGSTNSKTFKFKFGGSQFNAISVTGVTTTVGYGFNSSVRNRGAANSQYALNGTSGVGAAVSAAAALAVDTTTAQNLTITAQLGLSTETITLESYEVWLLP